jgi:AhpC/TSA family.
MKKIVFILIAFGISLNFPTLLLSQEISDNNHSSLKILDYPKSLSELLKQFEGQVVYIDLMASWCKPCIEEFKATKKNQSYFEENKIIKLFVTIDNKESIENAISMIIKNSLNGYFVSFHPQKETNTDGTFAVDIQRDIR